nr:hypothetical protein Iba_chr02bCG0250 [Ipomoea batatas]GME06963.1 hypothetical protein Iba_scaffold5767CG0280 [Ipomoea batatas]
MDILMEEVQGRRAFWKILQCYFLILHAHILPYLMTEIPPQSHNHQIHILSAAENLKQFLHFLFPGKDTYEYGLSSHHLKFWSLHSQKCERH